MVACELAAANPARVQRLVLMSPIGLWRDDAPVRNWLIIPEAERRQALFAAPDGEAARAFFAVPEDRDARAEAVAAFTWAQACVGKFVWPIPDKGLKKRIHRVAAQTLVLWGEQDRVAPPLYARDFARHIEGARVEVLTRAGHLPHLEQPEQVSRQVQVFLAGPTVSA
jgi:pimeloyl-ACP methyl ester carboxylesterase